MSNQEKNKTPNSNQTPLPSGDWGLQSSHTGGCGPTKGSESPIRDGGQAGGGLLFFFLYPLSLMPLRILYLLSDVLCLLISRVVKYRHRVIWNNLKVSFPEKTDEELRGIERGFYHYFCDYLVETIKLLSISREELHKRMTFSGVEELNRMFANGQSCAVYLGHLGCWEWITSLPLWVPADVQCAQIYHPLENAAFDKLFLRVRERVGAKCIAMNDTLREVVRMRREGKLACIGFISDQKPHWVNIHHWVDFLNHDTPVLTGTERIIRSSGYAAFYGAMTRPRRGYYNCEFRLLTENPKTTDEWQITDLYFQQLEENIRQNPTIWLWSHDRWKRTREEFNRRFEVKDGKVIARPDTFTIGFDAKRVVRNATGLGSYSRTLINSLTAVNDSARFILYAPDAGSDHLRQQVASCYNVRFAYMRPSVFSIFHFPFSNLLKAHWRSRGIVKDLKRDGVQLFHGLSGELPKGLRRAGIRSIVTIHDLIFLRHPEYYKRVDARLYERKFRRTLREADHIIAISECTKRDIMEFGHVPEEQISVIYQSCSTFFKSREGEGRLQDVNARYELPPRYIVSVGTIEERKNILLAVKALPLLPDDLSLVVVGRSTPYCEQVKRYVAENGLDKRVLFLHQVPNEDLPSIYQMAEACVYPSRYEGFGIPIIEAIQSGLPVVAATGSCLEEAGGPDSLYVDPDDHEAMARAINSCLLGAEGRDDRIRRSMDYVKRFENQDVALQIIEEYKKIIASPQPSPKGEGVAPSVVPSSGEEGCP